MADEWACDECGYITSAEPEAEKCPGCGAKMAKIVGVDDLQKGGDNYDDDALAVSMEDGEDDEEFDWEALKDIPDSEKNSDKDE